MIVSLIQRPTEVALGRKTVLVDGRQVGYFHGLGKPLLLTRTMDQEDAAEIKKEVERLEGGEVGKVAIPPPTPPEWTSEEEEFEDEDQE
jgi:hypothetical protein